MDSQDGRAAVREGPRQSHARGRRIWRLRRSSLGLGLAGVLAAGRVAAQTPTPQSLFMPGRLTVRPREMATATVTARAGVHVLDSLPGSWPEKPGLYVPKQCAGARRCPLIVFLWSPLDIVLEWLQPVADKYGMIVLYPADGNSSDFLGIRRLDIELQYVLRHFAIEPDKIAIIGQCGTAGPAQRIGGRNLDVFSRVVFLSGVPYPVDVDPPNGRSEFFGSAGLWESHATFLAAQALRQQGHRVTLAFGFHNHGHNWETYDAVGRWLQESWAHPNPADRLRPAVLDDSLPLLTTDVLAKLTAFWRRFLQEPDEVLMAGRREHLRDVVVPVGGELPQVAMTDMAALAARYPSVAAALKAAGLTAEEHDRYRVALASLAVTQSVGRVAGRIEPTSVTAKNIVFLNAHMDELATFNYNKGILNDVP